MAAVSGTVQAVPTRQPVGLGRWRVGWAFSAIWLVFLASAVSAAWSNPDRLRGAVALVALAVFAVGYVAVFARTRALRNRAAFWPVRSRLAVLAGAVALTALTTVGAGEHALAMAIYLAVLVMFVLPLLQALVGVALVAAATATLPRVVPGWHAEDDLALQVVITAFAIWGVLQLVERNSELLQAHQEIARMAVESERTRFARDLHDILGHSLTVLTVKAELAGRLVRIDPDRAEAEIAEVERLARDALADVRAAVAGYREANLAGELVAARAALDAIGIEAELPGAVDVVPGERRELFGWTVREGVTNVVRHSGARRCRIELAVDGVSVEDDGRGPRGHGNGNARADGVPHHGLEGLRERADAAGAALVVGRSALGGFLLRVEFPGPASSPA